MTAPAACTHCGAAISDENLHREWHAVLTKSLDRIVDILEAQVRISGTQTDTLDMLARRMVSR